jgi:glycosyltransferase involved in cell wall biosynthesis
MKWRVVYHEHDYPASGDDAAASAFMRAINAMRRLLARRAVLCVTPNVERAQLLQQSTKTRREIASVWNCPSREELAPPAAREEPPHLVLFYHGTIVPPRLPITLLDALARVSPNIRLHVVGYETIGHRDYSAVLQRKCRELNIDERVVFLGPMSRQQSLAQCRRADVGVSLFPTQSHDVNEQTMIGASNKPFDYLACGLALLVPHTPAWLEAFVVPGYGLSCDPADADSIANALTSLLEDRAATVRMGQLGQQRIDADWNYETQFARVYTKINRTRSA